MHGFKEQRHRINWHDGIKIHICYFTETNIDVFYLILCFTLYNHYCPFMISSTFLVPTIKYSKVQLSFCSLKFTIKNFLNIANNWRFNILTNKDKRWTTRIPTPQKRQIKKKTASTQVRCKLLKIIDRVTSHSADKYLARKNNKK